MGYEIQSHNLDTKIAAADLSAAQYKFVTLASTDLVNVTGAGADAYGVLQNKPKSGEAATIAHGGISKVVAGAAVAIGATVMSDASGRAITGTSTNQGLGVAVSAAGGAGEIIGVRLDKRGTI